MPPPLNIGNQGRAARILKKVWRKQAKRAANGVRQYHTNFDMVSVGPSMALGDITNKFPDLILFFCDKDWNNPMNSLIRSFEETTYARIEVHMDKTDALWIAKVFCGDTFLAEGNSTNKKEARRLAAARALKLLQETHYTIQEKRTYLPRKKFPKFLRNNVVSSHIFRVVCLSKPGGREFRYPLSGAIHYVDSEEELWNYIEDHGHSEDNADLFIFNIEKSDRPTIMDICRRTKMQYIPLTACSNRGMMVSKKEKPIKEIFNELKNCGFKNAKYQLIPPGSKGQASFESGSDGEEEEGGEEEEDCEKDEDGYKERKFEKEQHREIEISPWIADNLILMESLNEMNTLDIPREIIFMSVKNCPQLEEFIVERKRGSFGKVSAEALIDRKLVGRASGSKEKIVKLQAAENALANLKKVCYYIQAKPSYHGVGCALPEFLVRRPNRVQSTKIYRIVESTSVNNTHELNKLLKHFRTTHLEDLFFLDDFTYNEICEIYTLAKNMGYSVRRFGSYCLCVNKSKRPNVVFKELMATDLRENEKYKLIVPPAKLLQEKNERTSDNNLQHLFDVKPETNTDLNQSCDQDLGNVNKLLELQPSTSRDSEVKSINQNFTKPFHSSTSNISDTNVNVQGFSVRNPNQHHESRSTYSNTFGLCTNNKNATDLCKQEKEFGQIYDPVEDIWDEGDNKIDIKKESIEYNNVSQQVESQRIKEEPYCSQNIEREQKETSYGTAQQEPYVYRERTNVPSNQFVKDENPRDSNQRVQQSYSNEGSSYSYNRESQDRRYQERSTYENKYRTNINTKRAWDPYGQEQNSWREKEQDSYNSVDSHYNRVSQEPMNKIPRQFDRGSQSTETYQKVAQSSNFQRVGESTHRSGYNFTERQPNYRESEQELYKRNNLQTYNYASSTSGTGLWNSDTKKCFDQRR